MIAYDPGYYAECEVVSNAMPTVLSLSAGVPTSTRTAQPPTGAGLGPLTDPHRHLQMLVSNALLFMGCVLATIALFALIEYLHDVWIEHRWRRAKRRLMDALLHWSRH